MVVVSTRRQEMSVAGADAGHGLGTAAGIRAVCGCGGQLSVDMAVAVVDCVGSLLGTGGRRIPPGRAGDGVVFEDGRAFCGRRDGSVGLFLLVAAEGCGWRFSRA